MYIYLCNMNVHAYSERTIVVESIEVAVWSNTIIMDSATNWNFRNVETVGKSIILAKSQNENVKMWKLV